MSRQGTRRLSCPTIGISRKLIPVNSLVEKPCLHGLGRRPFRDSARSGRSASIMVCRLRRQLSAPSPDKCLLPFHLGLPCVPRWLPSPGVHDDIIAVLCRRHFLDLAAKLPVFGLAWSLVQQERDCRRRTGVGSTALSTASMGRDGLATQAQVRGSIGTNPCGRGTSFGPVLPRGNRSVTHLGDDHARCGGKGRVFTPIPRGRDAVAP